MKVLVVEDEHKIAHSIKRGLELEGYVVDVAYDGQSGYEMAGAEEFDVLVLDIMLPGMDGITVCKKLREDHIHTPILMLTAKGELDDKVTGLNTGADDYLVKPFAFAELIARLKALHRRPKQTLQQKLQIDDLEVDTTNYEVTRGDKKITLSKKEFSLLEYLIRHAGQTVTKDQIIQNVWNYEADVLPNTVEVYIGYLRQKIDKAFPESNSLIKTIRGFGYKLTND